MFGVGAAWLVLCSCAFEPLLAMLRSLWTPVVALDLDFGTIDNILSPQHLRIPISVVSWGKDARIYYCYWAWVAGLVVQKCEIWLHPLIGQPLSCVLSV